MFSLGLYLSSVFFFFLFLFGAFRVFFPLFFLLLPLTYCRSFVGYFVVFFLIAELL
jgi:hypothetical protein